MCMDRCVHHACASAHVPPRSRARARAGVFSDFVQLAAPRDSIFDAQEVQGGELGAGFFDDDEVLSNVDGDEEDDEELGPLKERRGGAKMASKGKKAPARKPKGGKAAGAGAKRKAPAAKGGAAKKQKQ